MHFEKILFCNTSVKHSAYKRSIRDQENQLNCTCRMKNVNLQKGELKLIPWDQRKSPTPFAEMSWLALAQRAIRDQRGNWKLNSLSKFLPYYIRTHAIAHCDQSAICDWFTFLLSKLYFNLFWSKQEKLDPRLNLKWIFAKTPKKQNFVWKLNSVSSWISNINNFGCKKWKKSLVKCFFSFTCHPG